MGLTWAKLTLGFLIGEEGPFTHIATTVAHDVLKTPCFAGLYQSNLHRDGILLAAFAAGTICNFGTVFGSTVFTLEITSMYFKT